METIQATTLSFLNIEQGQMLVFKLSCLYNTNNVSYKITQKGTLND